MTYSNMFARTAGAGVLVAGLVGCGSLPISESVNTTVRVPAVTDQNVQINRCVQNGFHFAQANAYNMGQVQQQNGNYSPYRYNNHNPLGNLFGNTGVSSQQLDTKNGSIIIQYPSSFRVNQEIFSKLAGGLIGAGIGGGYGRIVGATFGVAVLGPVFEAVSQKLTGPAEIEKHMKLAECVSDLLAINGGPATGTGFNPPGRPMGPAVPRPRQ